MKGLTQHYHHLVATQAKKWELALQKVEVDLSSLLDTDADELVEREEKIKIKMVSTTVFFDKSAVVGLMGGSEDVFTKLFE